MTKQDVVRRCEAPGAGRGWPRATGLLLALVLEAACLAAGCGGEAEAGRGEGVVTAVAAAEGKVSIDHGDIPGVMKAMTMEFQADSALLAGVETGSRVEFRVVYENGVYRLTELRPAAP